MQVDLDLSYTLQLSEANVLFTFEKNEDIIELLLYCDAVTRTGIPLGTLTMPYVPFGRQDRVRQGQAFSLAVFATLINALGFRQVVINDPHSDVTPALIHNCRVIEQWEPISELIHTNVRAPFWLVSPDAGALKKTHKLAQMMLTVFPMQHILAPCLGVVEASKQRNMMNGDITGTVVHIDACDPQATYCIVDDICDGGRTFIELARALRVKGAKTIHLYVTHGFFTKGTQVFAGIIDRVYAVHDHSARFV
jgi:ribose-phosphate pyrophosphokinase